MNSRHTQASGELHAKLREHTRQRATQPLWRRCWHYRPTVTHPRQPEHTTTHAHPETPGPEGTNNDNEAHDGITPTPGSAVSYHQQQPEQTMETTGRALSAVSHPRRPQTPRHPQTPQRPGHCDADARHRTRNTGHATPDTAATKRCGARQQAGPRTARLCVRTDARAHLRRWERRWRPPHRSTCP